MDKVKVGFRENIVTCREVLDFAKPYLGYDVIIISSSCLEESQKQERIFDQTFGQRTTSNQRPVIILSVIEDWPGGAGNLFGSLVAFNQARKKAFDRYGVDLDKLWQTGEVKIMLIHNGGEGKRANPLPQAENNSRGAIKMIGDVKTPNGKIPLTLLLAVAVQNSLFAASNDTRDIDIFWSSQIVFGTENMTAARSSGSLLTKFVQSIGKDTVFSSKMIHDLGVFELDKSGRVIDFVAQDTFKDIGSANAWLKSIEMGGVDLGSHRVKRSLFLALLKFYKENLIARDLKRDLDPQFTQPLVALMKSLEGVRNINEIDTPAKMLSSISAESRERLEVFDTCEEVISFFLANKKLTESVDQWVGIFDVGNQLLWWRYRRPLDILNERLLGLSDLVGEKIQVTEDGDLIHAALSPCTTLEAVNIRTFKGIQHPIQNSTIGGQTINSDTYTFEQIEAGVIVNGVFVKGSLIVNSNLYPGSSIEGSVINETKGLVLAENSCVDSSLVGDLEARRSLVYKVVEPRKLFVEGRSVVDVFRLGLMDEQFPNGQTRFDVSLGVDGKKYDSVRLSKNKYTFEQIRHMPNGLSKDLNLEGQIRQRTLATVNVRLTLGNGQEERAFSLTIPNIELLNEEERAELLYRIIQNLYNRMIFVGAIKITIESAFQLHPKLKEYFEEIKQILTSEENSYRTKEVLFSRAYYVAQMIKRVHDQTNPGSDLDFEFEINEFPEELDRLPEPIILPPQTHRTKRNSLAGLKALKGVFIGVDVGGSDVKVVAIKDCITNKLYEREFGEETGWRPQEFTSAIEYVEFIKKIINSVICCIPNEEKLIGIGISWPDLVFGDIIVGGDTSKTARLGAKTELESKRRHNEWNREAWTNSQYWDEFNKLGRLAEEIEAEFGVRVAVANDGNITALWAAVELERGGVLGIALGTSPGAGYVDSNGKISTMFLRSSNVAISFDRDELTSNKNSGILDVAQMHLAQSAAFRLCEKFEIDLTSNSKAARLEELQLMTDDANVNFNPKAIEIFEHLGKQLAVFLNEIYYDFGVHFPNTLLLTGRIVRDYVKDPKTEQYRHVQSGDSLVKGLKKTISDKYPRLHQLNIIFPEEVIDDKKLRRFAQAYGAIYLVNQKTIVL